MDSNRNKRRSFSKSNLVRTFYRAAAKSSGAALQPYSIKPAKPSPAHTSAEYQPIKPKAAPSSAAAGFLIVNQDQVFPQQTPKVAFVMADIKRDSYGKLESFYAGADDEGVDAKAAKYISSVQERFRLERVNSERKNFEEIHL